MDKTSCVKSFCELLRNIESRFFLLIPIIRSNTPPLWEEWGELNLHTIPLFWRNLWIWESSTFIVFNPSSLAPHTKFEPLSERSKINVPLMDINLRSAFMNEEEDISSISSICTALIDRQVNNTAHLLLLATLPQVFLVIISHGPKTSTPTQLNGGDGVTRSSGRSPIIWYSIFPRSFLHITHACNTLDISLLAPMIQ